MTSSDMNSKAKKPETGILELGQVDMSGLDFVARHLDNHWIGRSNDKPNNFGVFHSTDHVILKFCSFRDTTDITDWDLWEIFDDDLLPMMNDVASRYGITDPVFPRAMFARLHVNGKITPHVDGHKATGYCHKIHVPVQTNPDAMFFVGDHELNMERGKAYEVNNRMKHWCINGGDEERIHFIFEILNRDYHGSD